MNIVSNIKEGFVFSPRKYADSGMLKDVYASIDDLDYYYVPFSQTTYRGAIALYFKKALGLYKQTHQLS